jgi:DNA-binding FadR family transcriptional regulator
MTTTQLPPRTARLSDLVVRELAAEILRGDVLPSQLLPPEPELTRRFGLSRTVIREALRTLAAKGLVTIEHGRGTRVNPADRWGTVDPLLLQLRHEAGLLGEVLDELLEVRRIIESEVAALAAQRATPGQLAAIEATLAAMAASEGRLGAYTAADLEFHQALARAAGNSVLRGMLAPVVELLRIGVAVGAAGRHLARSLATHRRVYEAVAAGAAAGARSAMQAVVDEFERNIRHVYPPPSDAPRERPAVARPPA